jgi:ABC-type proline/glycine betaine transport system ATPase subunit
MKHQLKHFMNRKTNILFIFYVKVFTLMPWQNIIRNLIVAHRVEHISSSMNIKELFLEWNIFINFYFFTIIAAFNFYS